MCCCQLSSYLYPFKGFPWATLSANKVKATSEIQHWGIATLGVFPNFVFPTSLIQNVVKIPTVFYPQRLQICNITIPNVANPKTQIPNATYP